MAAAARKAGSQTIKCPVALRRHIAHFATKNGRLTTESMTDGHSVQGITAGVSVKCWAIQNMLTDNKIPHTQEGLMTVNNPARTGLWTAQGEFDEKVFEELAAHAIDDANGQKVLTRDIVVTWLAKRQQGKDFGLATKLAYVVPVTWKAVTDGSIQELFEYYSDSNVKKDKTIMKAMTLAKFRQFYTDPQLVVEERLKQQKQQNQ